MVGAGVGSILKGVLAPRVTRGFTPREVVQAFYSSMNKLDQMTMGACVIDGAGKGEINEVTNLYVISRGIHRVRGEIQYRVRGGLGQSRRPPIPPPQTLYGVTRALRETGAGGAIARVSGLL